MLKSLLYIANIQSGPTE